MSTRTPAGKLALLLVLALAAMAVSAQAASAFIWTDSSSLSNGATREVEGSAMGAFVLNAPAASADIEATGIEFVGAKIVQSGSTAAVEGKVKFSGLARVAGSSCSPSVTSLTTNALVGELAAASALTSKLALHLKPASGSVLATVPMVSGCPSFKVETAGYICAEVEPLTTMLVNQRVAFSPAILNNCGGSLRVATETATLTGEGTAHLTSGLSFGAS